MIVKAAIVGAVVGGIAGLFLGAPLESAATGLFLAVVFRKALLSFFWK